MEKPTSDVCPPCETKTAKPRKSRAKPKIVDNPPPVVAPAPVPTPAPAPTEQKKAARGNMNWINQVRKHSKDNKIPYREALIALKKKK